MTTFEKLKEYLSSSAITRGIAYNGLNEQQVIIEFLCKELDALKEQQPNKSEDKL